MFGLNNYSKDFVLQTFFFVANNLVVTYIVVVVLGIIIKRCEVTER